jgi:hypothetical protein
MSNKFLVFNEEQKATLQNAGIEFCDFAIADKKGIVLDEENYAKALVVLGAREKKTSPAAVPGFERPVLVFNKVAPEINHKVSTEDWNGEGDRRSYAKLVREILVPVVKKDVIIRVPHGDVCEVQSNRYFHINIWSAPERGEFNEKPPEKIWGIKVNMRDSGPKPSETGIVVYDEETGWAVGELIGDNLYIHHDLCHSGTKEEFQIFSRLLQEIALVYQLTPEQIEERKKAQFEKKKLRSRQEYIRECAKRLEKIRQGSVEKLERGKEEIHNLQRKLTQKILEMKGLERKLDQVSKAREAEEKEWSKEYDSILAVDGVKEIFVRNGIIRVIVEHVYITHENYEGKFLDIGEMEIKIFTDGSNGGVAFENLTRRGKGSMKGYNIIHPHVRSSGEACWGNISENVAELIGMLEYSALIQLCIEFLHTVEANEQGAGGDAFDCWPIVEPEAIKEKAA